MNETTASTSGNYLERQFLIAMPSMQDPNFAQGVTLMCQHNEEGAIGITINRPSEFTLLEVLRQLNLDCEDQQVAGMTVFEGGPVHPERGFVIHSPEGDWETSAKIDTNIMVTTSRDILAAIAKGEGPDKFLVALGYSGWSPGQLENEIRENAWLNTEADSGIIFDLPVPKRWEQAVSKLGIQVSSLSSQSGYA